VGVVGGAATGIVTGLLGAPSIVSAFATWIACIGVVVLVGQWQERRREARITLRDAGVADAKLSRWSSIREAHQALDLKLGWFSPEGDLLYGDQIRAWIFAQEFPQKIAGKNVLEIAAEKPWENVPENSAEIVPGKLLGKVHEVAPGNMSEKLPETTSGKSAGRNTEKSSPKFVRRNSQEKSEDLSWADVRGELRRLGHQLDRMEAAQLRNEMRLVKLEQELRQENAGKTSGIAAQARREHTHVERLIEREQAKVGGYSGSLNAVEVSPPARVETCPGCNRSIQIDDRGNFRTHVADLGDSTLCGGSDMTSLPSRQAARLESVWDRLHREQAQEGNT
jgi:hypothetical protein